MKRLPLFYSDVFAKENVGTDEEREDLKKQILDAKKHNIGATSNSNDGCWRSHTRYMCDWLHEAVDVLAGEANNFYFENDQTYKKSLEKCTNKNYGYWTNVNEIGSKNILHTHTEHSWAGIYYVQAEGTGDLTFINPANVLLQCNYNSPFTRRTSIKPKDGMLILWPGWVPHEVEENKSNKQRINLAWGINYN